MKNLVFNLTVALVVLTNVNHGSYDTKREVKASRNENPVSLMSNVHFFEKENFPVTAVSNELKHHKVVAFSDMNRKVKSNEINGKLTSTKIKAVADEMFYNSNRKTIEEVIAEDNAITENSFSNESQALDFVAIKNMLPSRVGKSIDEVIAEDNAIIESNFSNESQTLDFVAIENMLPSRVGKSIDDVIAEDNAITESNFLNETQALDFNVINAKPLFEVTIDNVAFNKSEKTIDEIIVENNEITDNNSSNEIQTLNVIQ